MSLEIKVDNLSQRTEQRSSYASATLLKAFFESEDDTNPLHSGMVEGRYRTHRLPEQEAERVYSVSNEARDFYYDHDSGELELTLFDSTADSTGQLSAAGVMSILEKLGFNSPSADKQLKTNKTPDSDDHQASTHATIFPQRDVSTGPDPIYDYRKEDQDKSSYTVAYSRSNEAVKIALRVSTSA